MWTDAVTRKMYVTGGVGTTGNEGFGEPYVLPNISAYAETCAVLMFMPRRQVDGVANAETHPEVSGTEDSHMAWLCTAKAYNFAL